MRALGREGRAGCEQQWRKENQFVHCATLVLRNAVVAFWILGRTHTVAFTTQS
jgi:hypothetical protein